MRMMARNNQSVTLLEESGKRTSPEKSGNLGKICLEAALEGKPSGLSCRTASSGITSPSQHAAVAELADALDSGSSGRKVVEVQVLSAAFLWTGQWAFGSDSPFDLVL
jgi:hypothetical protein